MRQVTFGRRGELDTVSKRHVPHFLTFAGMLAGIMLIAGFVFELVTYSRVSLWMLISGVAFLAAQYAFLRRRR